MVFHTKYVENVLFCSIQDTQGGGTMPWGSVVSKCPQSLGLYLSARGLLANERVWRGGLSTLSLFSSFISLLLVFLQLDYIQSFDIKVGWGSPGFGDTDLKTRSSI